MNYCEHNLVGEWNDPECETGGKNQYPVMVKTLVTAAPWRGRDLRCYWWVGDLQHVAVAIHLEATPAYYWWVQIWFNLAVFMSTQRTAVFLLCHYVIIGFVGVGKDDVRGALHFIVKRTAFKKSWRGGGMYRIKDMWYFIKIRDHFDLPQSQKVWEN